MDTPYTVDSLAERWKCNHLVVRKLIDQGDLRFFKLGRKLIRISAE